jgi:hypothetical protein
MLRRSVAPLCFAALFRRSRQASPVAPFLHTPRVRGLRFAGSRVDANRQKL